MSSHREAPEISKDPVADSTDLYAFFSPDKLTRSPDRELPPLSRLPAVRTSMSSATTSCTFHIDNDGDGKPEITY